MRARNQWRENHYNGSQKEETRPIPREFQVANKDEEVKLNDYLVEQCILSCLGFNGGRLINNTTKLRMLKLH